MDAHAAGYEIQIRARRSIWDVDWHGILHYRDLLLLLIRRDFVSKYKQTVLGPPWMVIQPLLTTIVFTIIFAKVVKISTDSVPPVLFYMSGLLGWNLFAQILNGSGNVLQANAHLFGKVYFPRIIVPFANVLSSFIPFAIQFALFLVVDVGMAWFGGKWAFLVDVQVLALPLFVIQAALVATGASLIFSSLTAVYRDLQHLLSFVVQIWMYLTPIIYPASQFPEHRRWLVQLNPMTVPVEGIRWALLGVGTLSMGTLLLSWSMALAFFAIGFLWFNQVERSYVDRA